ncbi:MAG: hypothetical protein HKP53_04090, partial [Eudoraea sp.]|nr:hypothetical protein [Eudoraea sp.]
MRTIFNTVAFLLLFLCTVPAIQAQYNQMYGATGRRRIAPQTQEPREKDEPMTAEELVAAEMPKITKALSLNDFEQDVLKTTLT